MPLQTMPETGSIGIRKTDTKSLGGLHGNPIGGAQNYEVTENMFKAHDPRLDPEKGHVDILRFTQLQQSLYEQVRNVAQIVKDRDQFVLPPKKGK